MSGCRKFSRFPRRFLALSILMLITLIYFSIDKSSCVSNNCDSINFDDFDNQTGAGDYIVPNIVHLIRFNQTRFRFDEYICLMSIFVNHQPDWIYIHTNADRFQGRYWTQLKKMTQLMRIIKILPIEIPSEIFGQKISEEWQVWHGSDIARIKILMKYGGIYLDTDVYVVQDLNSYRKYEMTVGWDSGNPFGTQVLIAHKNARFLRLWLQSYDDYREDLWYYNAGERPTSMILEKNPGLVHRVQGRFGVAWLMLQLYETYWPQWRNQQTVHLLTGFRPAQDSNYRTFPRINERNLHLYNFTYGDMARDILAKVKKLT